MHQCLLPRIVNIPKDSIKVKIDLYLVHPGQRLCQLCAQVVYHLVHREYHGEDRVVEVEYLNISPQHLSDLSGVALAGLLRPRHAHLVQERGQLWLHPISQYGLARFKYVL